MLHSCFFFSIYSFIIYLFIYSLIYYLLKLLFQINKEQINILLEMVNLSRKVNCRSGATRHKELTLTPIHRMYFPDTPFFPNLKKLSILSKVT